MRILIHSNAPWCHTGYGVQTGLFAPRLAELGHDVAVSSFFGLQGSTTVWKGIDVYPQHRDPYGADAVALHAHHFRADLVLTLCDVWVLYAPVFADLPTVAWTPVDCTPLSSKDRDWFEASSAIPAAMARHGHRLLDDAGFDPLYVPHGIDTTAYTPHDQASVRADLGLPTDAFIIGINAANKGANPCRKAFPQQFEAFARLARRHDDALLMLHTDLSGDVDLLALVDGLGIDRRRVTWSDQYSYRSGMLVDAYLAAWYSACDLVSNASYGEGFGLPTVEAQACGVPVVVTNNSASAELVGSGWKVPGIPHWNGHHAAWWSAPDVDQLARVYEKAYAGEAAKRRGHRGVEFAAGFDADHVTTEHWKPALDQVGERL